MLLGGRLLSGCDRVHPQSVVGPSRTREASTLLHSCIVGAGALNRFEAATAQAGGHHTPTGWYLVVLIVIGLLYVAWRAGRLGKLRGVGGRMGLRRELKGVRISPIALVPTLLLAIVVVVLLIDHS